MPLASCTTPSSPTPPRKYSWSSPGRGAPSTGRCGWAGEALRRAALHRLPGARRLPPGQHVRSNSPCLRAAPACSAPSTPCACSGSASGTDGWVSAAPLRCASGPGWVCRVAGHAAGAPFAALPPPMRHPTHASSPVHPAMLPLLSELRFHRCRRVCAAAAGSGVAAGPAAPLRAARRAGPALAGAPWLRWVARQRD